MTKRSSFAEAAGEKQHKVDECEPRPGAIAARDELTTLEKLSRAVWSVMAEFSRRPTFSGKISEVDLAINDVRQSKLKGYEELAHHCYGRTVTGEETDDRERPLGKFTYRITQANVGDVDCGILARNSPLASQLVTRREGEEAEVEVPRGARYLKVNEVRILEGPNSLLAPSQQPNFRLMNLRKTNLREPLTVVDLRAFVSAIRTQHSSEDAAAAHGEVHGGIFARRADELPDPTWLENWTNIHLGSSDVQSLGHQFFTGTTPDQEKALNNPHGVTFVEGIAGSGKTSVALGRLKFFANFATGENREYYGLQLAPENDFSPAGMTGFVLSHSLKRYLHETAIELGLERLPIRDFPEFRAHLSNQFGLTQAFKRNKTTAPGVRTRLAWMRAIDAAMADIAGLKLRNIALNTSNIAPLVRDSIIRLSHQLIGAKPHPDEALLHLSGLAQRVAAEVMAAEFRAREIAIREKMKKEKFTLELERELVRVQQEEEHGVVSPFVLTVLGVLAARDLFIAAVGHDKFPSLVRQAFEDPVDTALLTNIDVAIAELRALIEVREEGGRRSLTDADLVTLIASAAMIADGFEYTDSQIRFFQVRRNTGIFIDEIQDFTEVEIFLMGMTVRGAYNQITLSGDRFQRLQSSGSTEYQRLFPFVPKSQHNQSFFLDYNFRQRERLAAFSWGFRAVLQGDDRLDRAISERVRPATMHSFSSREQMAALILERIQSVDPYATVAIVAPTEQQASEWFDLLGEELASGHRPALLSRRDDLTRRVDIHFTAVHETKGLEFDVVVVPDIGSFTLDDEVGRNEAYVAISRAKNAMLIGCSSDNASKPELLRLVTSGVARVVKIATH